MTKSKNHRVRECRSCKRMFKACNGEASYNNCCTNACLALVGPMPVIIPDTVLQKFERDQRRRANRQATKLSRKQLRVKKGKEKKLRHAVSDAFYKSREWLELRFDVIKAYGRICMLCGKDSGTMHVDHIIPRSKQPELALDFNNLQVLCRDCNLGKGTRDKTDFRTNDWVTKPKPLNLPVHYAITRTQGSDT